MKTLSFPTGSIGALLDEQPTATRGGPIAIPRDFSASKAPDALDAEARWIQLAAAAMIACAVLLAGWLVG